MSKTTDKMKEASQKIVDLMEREGTNSVKPWISTAAAHNVISKKAYRGMNTVWLGLSAYENDYTSNEWATFKQWNELGATINKGEKATDIFFFNRIVKKDEETGKDKSIGLCKYLTVFNANQVSGYQSPVKASKSAFSISAVDNYVANTGADISHGKDSAFFSPVADFIGMPNKTDFESVEGYYSTLLHELTHWTGHSSRLDRNMSTLKSDEEYAKEELVAECGSALLCTLLGVTREPTPNHAKYLNAWISRIKDNPKTIFTAMSKAQKAIDFLGEFQCKKDNGKGVYKKTSVVVYPSLKGAYND